MTNIDFTISSMGRKLQLRFDSLLKSVQVLVDIIKIGEPN